MNKEDKERITFQFYWIGSQHVEFYAFRDAINFETRKL
jgi:hypothetical protein